MKINYERPHLYPKQRAAIFTDARTSVIEASTKTGKTAGCLAWIHERALQGPRNSNHWWVAPVGSQAQIAFSRMRDGLDRRAYTAHQSPPWIQLRHGPKIWFKSGDRPDSLYGEDVYSAVVDEASRLKEEAQHAVRTTLTATKGPVRYIGNVKGRKNWFYRMARRVEADNGAHDSEYHKLIAHDAVEAGVLDAAEIEAARRELPEHVFRELYLAEASDDDTNPFGLDAISDCLIDRLSSRPPVVFGWDLAKSTDWSVGIGLDVNGDACVFERFQHPWEETFARIKRVTGSVPALVDATGVGDPILERLQKAGRNYEGFKFSSTSKQQLMEGLAVALQHTEIGFPDGPIRLELESFEFEVTRTGTRYTAPAGMHDDCVCALALAVAKRRRKVYAYGTRAVSGLY